MGPSLAEDDVLARETHADAFLCKRISQKSNKIPVIWIKQQALIAVFNICSGRQLILCYSTHHLFSVFNHPIISLQTNAKVLHFCSFSSFHMEIKSSEYWLWFSRIFSTIIPGEEKRRPGIKGICLIYCLQFDLESGSQIRSGMTNEILFSNPRIILTCS